MTKEELQDVILSFTNDVLLDYPEHDTIFINPFHIHKFLLSYEDIEKVYDSIEALMSDIRKVLCTCFFLKVLLEAYL